MKEDSSAEIKNMDATGPAGLPSTGRAKAAQIKEDGVLA